MGGAESKPVILSPSSGPVFYNGKYHSYSNLDLTKEGNNGDQNSNCYEDDDLNSNETSQQRICGSFFCPPSKSRSHKDGNYDKMGTPLPDTPDYIRKRRHQLYNGLEVEDSLRWVRAPSVDIKDGMDGEVELATKYELREILGVGSTSTCHRCVHRNTGISYACKIIDKRTIEERFKGMIDQFHSEIKALRSLHHPNIITLYDVYITNDKIYIVMELMEGGELFDYVVQKGTLNEEEASRIVRMVTSALVYMHGKNIIHRDLKPENLLLTHKPRNIHEIDVKIIDFGLSKQMNEPVARSFLGTRGYIAPEIIQRREYSREVDAWALGVIVFVLLCGCMPFDDDSKNVTSDDQIRSKFRLRFPRWARGLSSSAKDLLSHLLDVNPRSRFTAEEAFEHPWVKGYTADKKNLLQSPGKIKMTPGGGKVRGTSSALKSPLNSKATRNHMNQMMANRARANSNHRTQRQMVRKTSI